MIKQIFDTLAFGDIKGCVLLDKLHHPASVDDGHSAD